MENWGFTTGIVYCVQSSIAAAVKTYVTAMQSALRYYEGMMAAVAIMLFGFKLMSQNVQEPIKETAGLAFRIMIGVFFYEEAVSLYNMIAGTLPDSDGIMNQAIGWVSGTTASGTSSGNMFSSLISASCSTTTPPQTFEGYQVWQAFDCIFSKLMGAANPATHPYAFSTSLLVIVAASLFSATMGVMAASLGITLFISILLLVFRALYLVLMSYVCIGFMTLFAPVFAPMLFFESEYLKKKFMNWAGVLISSIFQPVLVIGFLAMAVAIDDQILEGNFASPGCTLPTYPGASGASGAPAEGWGHNGSGVCSFTQLLNQGQNGASLQTLFSNFMDNNATFFNQSVGADPQAGVNNIGLTSAGFASGTTNSPTANSLNERAQNASSINWSAATRLKDYVPIKQLMLTLITFIFVTFALKQLLEVIPSVASSLTLGTGIDLWRGLVVPFENEIKTFLNRTTDSAGKALKGKSLKSLLKPTTKSGAGSSAAKIPGQTTTGTITRPGVN